MQLVRDEPGRVVHLEHVGGRLTRRHGRILLILAILWAVPLVVVWVIASRELHATALGTACFLAGWCAFAALMTVALTKAARRPQRLFVDRASGNWTLAERGLWALREESVEIPASTIERFIVRTVESVWSVVPGAVPLEVELIPSGRKILLELEWVDRFEEVLDLALRIGLASGLTRYRVTRSSLTEFEAEMSSDAARSTEPIPRIVAPADYEGDDSAAEGRVDRPGAGPFAAGAWPGPYRLECWEPGRLVVFHFPSNYGLLGCLALMLSLFLIAGLLPLWEGISKRDLSALGFAAFWYGLLIAMLWSASRGSRGSWTWIDWREGQIRTRTFLGNRSAPIDAVRRIDVVGLRRQHSEGEDGPNYTKYKCQVLAIWRDGQGSTRSIRVVETSDAREDPDTPYRTAWPLAEALAEALHVPARFKNYR